MKRYSYWCEFVIVLFVLTLFLSIFLVVGGWDEIGVDRYFCSFFSLSIVTILSFIINLALSTTSRLSTWTISLTATVSTSIMALIVLGIIAFKVDYLSIVAMILAGLFSLIALGSIFSILMATSRHYGKTLNYFSLVLEALFIMGVISATTFIF